MADTVDTTALLAWVREFARLIEEHRDLLTELDSAIGDADHGVNLHRGMSAVVAALAEDTPDRPAELFKRTGMTLVSTVGGASGPLYGTAFLRMSAAAGDAETLDGADVAKILRAALDGVVARGKAQAGDKTMYDALAPAVAGLEEAVGNGQPLSHALGIAVRAAEQGREATIPMVARKGRASYLGERSAGHPDPGATSVTLLVVAAAAALA
ncbi:dihydroxyacetone kinase subunit DhaL [Paractinoplanes durhamensis]|uniref:Dihydroxyacetone kinase subunit L n=1 Tax=Paractinoplanes durhamensis TaxID=113563 RepID=A0ABQ3ZB92_9ACTN|nr:dihydroxyacetone kinase subunit DhaL [Actinoplanes durhamensis]GIE07099.1 dihydroxyacetone kinase subunit L [Actinoplanes durhamensis]